MFSFTLLINPFNYLLLSKSNLNVYDLRLGPTFTTFSTCLNYLGFNFLLNLTPITKFPIKSITYSRVSLSNEILLSVSLLFEYSSSGLPLARTQVVMYSICRK
jgi:hypothetical protein